MRWLPITDVLDEMDEARVDGVRLPTPIMTRDEFDRYMGKPMRSDGTFPRKDQGHSRAHTFERNRGIIARVMGGDAVVDIARDNDLQPASVYEICRINGVSVREHASKRREIARRRGD